MTTLRDTLRGLLLNDMLNEPSLTGAGHTEYKALVLDSHTTKVLSSFSKMSDLLEHGITLVEDLHKRREPLTFEAVYFISPTEESISLLLSDYTGRPLYPAAHVFFCGPCPGSLLERLRREPALLSRLQTMKEVPVNFQLIDGMTFCTGQRDSLRTLFGEHLLDNEGRACMETITMAAERITSLFLALKDFPHIRYSNIWAGDDLPGNDLRAQLTHRLAAEVQRRLDFCREHDSLAFERDCQLLILDRSYDVVAPIMHEYSYEAVAHDVLPLRDNVYEYKMDNAQGKSEVISVLLDDATDEVWAGTRHMHVAAAGNLVNARFNTFMSEHQHAARKPTGDAPAMDSKGMQKLIRSLPQYREQLRTLSIHIDIISGLYETLKARDFGELAELEQALVLHEAKGSNVVSYLTKYKERQQQLAAAGAEVDSKDGKIDCVRVIMTHLATHASKLDADKRKQWKTVAGLEDGHLDTMRNLAWLGVKLSSGKGKLAGWSGKRKAPRKYSARPPSDHMDLKYFRFQPLLADILRELIDDKLSTEQFPSITGTHTSMAASPVAAAAAQSARTRHHQPTWATKGAGAKPLVSPADVKVGQKRVVVFVMGGLARNEMRVAAEVATATGVEVIAGSTSVDTPRQFLTQVFHLGDSEPGGSKA